jgi:hypothetical protein
MIVIIPYRYWYTNKRWREVETGDQTLAKQQFQ